MGSCTCIVKIPKPHIQHFSLKGTTDEQIHTSEIIEPTTEPSDFRLVISNLRGVLFAKVKINNKTFLESNLCAAIYQ